MGGQTPAGAAFYFRAQLHDTLGIPIGLVNRAFSDTAIGERLPPETAADADGLWEAGPYDESP